MVTLVLFFRTTNLLAETIIEKCAGTVSHLNFESVMRRPNFIREFLIMCDETAKILKKEKRVLGKMVVFGCLLVVWLLLLVCL